MRSVAYSTADGDTLTETVDMIPNDNAAAAAAVRFTITMPPAPIIVVMIARTHVNAASADINFNSLGACRPKRGSQKRESYKHPFHLFLLLSA
jgi:hypothetical protein